MLGNETLDNGVIGNDALNSSVGNDVLKAKISLTMILSTIAFLI